MQDMNFTETDRETETEAETEAQREAQRDRDRETPTSSPPPPFQLNPDPLWHPTGGHHGDISTMDFLQPAMLATGAEDGTIKIWNTNLMKTVADFNPREAVRQRVPSANHSTGVQSLLATANKTPVDRVLWLRTRVKAGRRAKTASLVASGQGGLCQFWSPFKGTLMGWFTASHSRLANEVCVCVCVCVCVFVCVCVCVFVCVSVCL